MMKNSVALFHNSAYADRPFSPSSGGYLDWKCFRLCFNYVARCNC